MMKKWWYQFFWILSGDDKDIISECSDYIKARFMLIGMFVFVIFLLCFISSYVAFAMFFNSPYLGIPLSMFFAWMITNIYLLLLYTLSLNSFPISMDKKVSRLASLVVRGGFIVFIATMISKPLETLIFADKLSTDIQTFKEQQIEDYEKLTRSYYEEETATIKLIIQNDGEDSEVYLSLLEESNKEREAAITDMKSLINNSTYYTQSIIILNSKYPVCWLFTVLIVIVFLYPAYQKRFIGEQDIYDKFYKIKKHLEQGLVKREYQQFKVTYARIFKERFNKDIEFQEDYLDPPFNTKKKVEEVEYLTESDLISDLYA